jgi:catechol 2,3-dioxygenase-like lactoylglutathione lyase family enzyme
LPDEAGAPPQTGWAWLAPELLVTDLDASLAFWRDLLGFRVAYSRPGFVYLERAEGAQIMLSVRDGGLETGPMQRPFGRGTLFQVYVVALAAVAESLSEGGWPLYAPIREVWRQWGDREGGQRELFVQDPDGYLVMVAQHIGERPLPA